ncbi:hypothetical protein RB195_012180 [Necator americanus]|uniref:ZP domain-containing protein n=1 Tax=Necator americanus TaxID=51031 RepID=A0ABR1D6U8_NECAM
MNGESPGGTGGRSLRSMPLGETVLMAQCHYDSAHLEMTQSCVGGGGTSPFFALFVTLPDFCTISRHLGAVTAAVAVVVLVVVVVDAGAAAVKMAIRITASRLVIYEFSPSAR